MYNINSVILTYLMMFWINNAKVRKTYIDSGAWAWSFELLPLDVLESARVTEKEVPSSLIPKEEQRFGFLFGISGFFYEGFNFLFSPFFTNLSSKSQALERVMEQSIYRWVYYGFGGKTNGIQTFLVYYSNAF